MTDAERADDEEVAQMAVKALAEAQRSARASGRTRVVLVGRKLMRIGPSGSVELKTLPPRTKVAVRVKQIRK